ncbi:MAG: integrase arm-type DNA-binding domain-containing protein [Rhodospirillaceae bacterium]|jgi:integrase|nr:integrase arm-type DNA-binding domain-containing protein [Rhodospirillaceae bacterium]MBT6205931.1 integrase arm-type DNA-binding domain-containing protein [Rhodospirillaceae bacterium]MBT6511511.1 integrase arm-type DNA-binding domain-containing protein [Rhodospirillaceae bacterium]
MKPRGRHPINALSAVQVKNLKKAGKYADGNGLYLIVDPSGAKRWMFRTVVQARKSPRNRTGRIDMWLGSTQLVQLAEAREIALRYRKIAREGGDPVALKRTEKERPTFRQAAQTVHENNKKAWSNGKHVNQWITTLETYAYPVIGDKRVNQIATADIESILQPIWLEKPETARRVRQRIRAVLDWATSAGHREGANPAITVGPGLPKQRAKVKHHRAMLYAEVPAFVRSLNESDAANAVRLALEWTILTAARTSETLGATFSEIDLEAAVWTVPPERMKADVEHRVPLAGRCLEIVERARGLSDGQGFVFPSNRYRKPLSNVAMLQILRRRELDCTVHGFRSSFRDWAAEQTSFPRDVCEAALAHVVENKVEAAYRRSDLFGRRRALMEAWEDYVGNAASTVVQLSSARRKP